MTACREHFRFALESRHPPHPGNVCLVPEADTGPDPLWTVRSRPEADLGEVRGCVRPQDPTGRPRIAFERLLHQQRQTVEATKHVRRVTARDRCGVCRRMDLPAYRLAGSQKQRVTFISLPRSLPANADEVVE